VATRPCVSRACALRGGPLAEPRCTVLPDPQLRWFRPVLRPCVRLGVFSFGIALRCVAMLCAVYVPLHLVLFLAGGPVPPFLYLITLFLFCSGTWLTRRCNLAGLASLGPVFIAGALQELSVALCRGNASLGRSGLNALTLAAGCASLCGLSSPLAEVV
jgi:hypothetical protein